MAPIDLSPTTSTPNSTRFPDRSSMGLQQYACRCLNITISSTSTNAASEPTPAAPVHFEKVHVGDTGIMVVGVLQLLG
jgi:hypothetical protein